MTFPDDVTIAGRELVVELRALLLELNERDNDLATIERVTETVREARAAITGPRRPRWYERGLEPDGRSAREARQHFNEHALYRGEQHAFAPPMRTETATETDGRRVIKGYAHCTSLYEGPPGGVHGGYVAGLFDDVLGSAQSLIEGPTGLTGTLTVRYRKLTPLDTDLVFTAWVDKVAGRRIHARATCHAGPTLTAEAEILFVRVDMADIAGRAAQQRASHEGPGR